jgi:hypothetical protein
MSSIHNHDTRNAIFEKRPVHLFAGTAALDVRLRRAAPSLFFVSSSSSSSSSGRLDKFSITKESTHMEKNITGAYACRRGKRLYCMDRNYTRSAAGRSQENDECQQDKCVLQQDKFVLQQDNGRTDVCCCQARTGWAVGFDAVRTKSRKTEGRVSGGQGRLRCMRGRCLSTLDLTAASGRMP